MLPLNKLDAAEINRLAFATTKIIADEWLYRISKKCGLYDYELNDYAKNVWKCTFALFTRNIFWEIKEYGQLQTHPEDLMNYALASFDTECHRQSRPADLIYVCRAFAGRFADFNSLPRREIYCYNKWRLYPYSERWFLKQYWTRGYDSREIYIDKVYSHDEFGKNKDFLGWGIFEYWKDEAYEVHEEQILQFDDKSEAKYFLVQLVELLNVGKKHVRGESGFYEETSEDDYIHQEAAQLIRDTLAQAPLEEIRMREEKEAAERAAQLERECLELEKQQRLAEQQRKRLENMRTGVHVYIFQLDNDTCKIGISDNVRRRICEVEQGGLDVLKFTCTEQGFRKDEAAKIEKTCHKFFKDKLKRGEFFRITFDEACNKLKEFGDIYPAMDRNEI